MRSVKLTALELVYTPMSNQEAEWLQEVPEVEEILRTSDFYMIAARAEAKFTDFDWDPDKGILSFNFTIEGELSDPVQINMHEFVDTDHELDIELGPKLIRARDAHDHDQVLQWVTTERLVWLRGRGVEGIYGFDNYREASNYDLLYVGIAKSRDSFARMFEDGHRARTKILSNEPQRSVGARPTDEIYLFLFDLHPLVIREFSEDDDFDDPATLNPLIDDKRIVADAEKAYVHLLDPEYNLVKFKDYPRGADGLYQSEYDSYGYVIAENMTVNTENAEIRGGRDNLRDTFSNDADGIHIHGDVVEIIRHHEERRDAASSSEASG